MFSWRMAWETRPNAVSRAVERYRASGAELLDLTVSSPAQAGLGLSAEQVLAPLAGAGALRYEPSAMGLLAAREAVSRHCYGGSVGPERILLAASTSEIYGYLFRLLANPGDDFLAPSPSYPLFDHLASLDSVTIRPYPLHYHEGWWIDMEALKKSIQPRTRAILVVNPNNPTGSYVQREQLAALVAVCRDHDLALISDEVFFDFALGVEPVSVAAIDEVLTFTLGGLSKTVGLPQMKLGWVAVNGPAALRAAALERLEMIADTYLSVSAPVQHAAPAWLEHRADFRERVVARVRENLAAAASEGAELLRVEGGWYGTLRLGRGVAEEEQILGLLEERGVLVQPGYFYDFPFEPVAVVSLIAEPALFREGVRRVALTAVPA